MPNALTKPAAASPAVSASAPTASVMTGATSGAGLPIAGSSDWNSSHSLTKPLSGGRPAMARLPTRKQAAVHGSRRMSPPRRFMSRRPVACTTEPAPRNSRLLKTVWFSAW